MFLENSLSFREMRIRGTDEHCSDYWSWWHVVLSQFCLSVTFSIIKIFKIILKLYFRYINCFFPYGIIGKEKDFLSSLRVSGWAWKFNWQRLMIFSTGKKHIYFIEFLHIYQRLHKRMRPKEVTRAGNNKVRQLKLKR